MTDIVERLRKWSVFGYGYEASCDMKEAATAIEAQRANIANAARLLSEQTAEIERLRVQNIQMQAALGYAICAEDERHIIPSNPFKCGVCDARNRAWKDAPPSPKGDEE